MTFIAMVFKMLAFVAAVSSPHLDCGYSAVSGINKPIYDGRMTVPASDDKEARELIKKVIERRGHIMEGCDDCRPARVAL